MSMEITVVSDISLDSIAAWQQAIDTRGFDLALDEQATFQSLRGFLPATVGGKVTGFECFHDVAQELAKSYDDRALRRDWKRALSFRGGGFDECLTAWMAATAYATATKGVVFDQQEGKLLRPQDALAATRMIEKERPAYEQMMRDVLNQLNLGT
jgi:hypothetical protein